MDEEETFSRITDGDSAVNLVLADQDAALHGSRGALLRAVATSDGTLISNMQIPSLPVWDGMVAARGKLYIATMDGSVVCMGE